MSVGNDVEDPGSSPVAKPETNEEVNEFDMGVSKKECMEAAIKYLNTNGKEEPGRFFLFSAVRAALRRKNPELDLELWYAEISQV